MFSKNLRFFSLFLACLAALAQDKPGTITGQIIDKQTGRGIVGVTVAVDQATDLKVVTDSDGRYTISVAPGAHTLRLSAADYQPVEISNVEVTSDRVTQASAPMSNEKFVEQVDVVEKLDSRTSTAEAMLTERKLSVVVSDSVGREELSQGVAGDAAGALEKVPGVSVVGDGFVYVRGLGERYSATSLNGSLVPTTEPEKRVVPLDMFPSGMIDNIKVAKTYSPDLPAEFSGGLVQLQTTEFPPKSFLTVSLKGGFNTQTTFSPFLSYPGPGGDYWGLGAGDRGIPSLIGDRRLLGNQFTRQQMQEFGRSFANNWEAKPINSMRPANDWSISSGTSAGKLGLTGALSFSNKPQARTEIQRYIRQGVGGPFIFTDYSNYREDSEAARLGGVFNASYRFNPANKLVLRNTLTHDAEKMARRFSGYDGSSDAEISGERLRYIERNLFSTGLAGEHLLGWAGSSINWQFNVAQTRRDEPDLREVLRSVLPNGESYASSTNSGIRFFSKLQERIYEPQVDFTLPFYRGSIVGLFKVGFRASIRNRDFEARRFRFIPQDSTTIDVYAPSNVLFDPSNIRPNGLEIVESTRGTDKYNGTMDIYAGYAMVDLSLGSKWRAVLGVRIEDAEITVNTVDPQVIGSVPAISKLKNTDPAPSLNLIYSVTPQQNLRLSFSRTLSRPDFRELSPFDFVNVQGGFVTTGFTGLKRVAINNYDLRWEAFPGGNQLIAASVFVKTFQNPIEQVVLASNDLRQSFRNAKSANNAGFELEYRHGLGRYIPALKDFSVSSNFTFVNSNIEIAPENRGVLTTTSRPMMGQSKYVFNGTLQWSKPNWHSDARFFSNWVSRRITDLGTFGTPDIYQEPVTTLDFAYQYTVGDGRHWSYRFEAENLTNTEYHWTQAQFNQRLYRLGRTFQVGITYSFF